MRNRRHSTQSGLLHSWNTCPKADIRSDTNEARLPRSPMRGGSGRSNKGIFGTELNHQHWGISGTRRETLFFGGRVRWLDMLRCHFLLSKIPLYPAVLCGINCTGHTREKQFPLSLWIRCRYLVGAGKRSRRTKNAGSPSGFRTASGATSSAAISSGKRENTLPQHIRQLGRCT
jgi:hypothetical protein